MKQLIIIFILAIGFNLNAQNIRKSIKLVISPSYIFNGIIRPQKTRFNNANFMLGVKINRFAIFTTYDVGFSRINFPMELNHVTKYEYHQIGLSLKYYLLKPEHKIAPFVMGKISTQIATNYANSLMSQSETPIKRGDETLGELSSMYGTSFGSYEEYDSWVGNSYYTSTAFLGSLIVGCDFILFKGLSLDIGVGFGTRNIKTKKPVTGSFRSNYKFSLDAQLGLSYAIPLKKKE